MDKFKKCEECGNVFSYVSGQFTTHVKKEHNLTLKEYVVKYEYSGKTPKCECGYCDEDAPFFRGKFLKIIGKHKKYDWLKKQHIKKYGEPKCETCGGGVGWKRGKPNKYCSFKCLPNRWNQDKVLNTVEKKYGVKNVSFLDEVKEKISNKLKVLYEEEVENIKLKYKETTMERYGVEHYTQTEEFSERYRETCLERYGVDNIFKTVENRDASSKRMIENNSKFNFKEYFKVKRYKDTELCYQSLYEFDFLEKCEDIGIIDKVKNGNVYNFLIEEREYGFRTLTDFNIEDFEIEIKSSYILEKQGGEKVLNIKRNAIEREGKRYLLILDKDYTEFDKIFKK